MNDMRMVASCFYYGLAGDINHIPAWRHFQTLTNRLELGGMRLDGRWYRRLIRTETGDNIPALGVWNPETDITVIIVSREFHDRDRLISEVESPVMPEQLRAEEWAN